MRTIIKRLFLVPIFLYSNLSFAFSLLTERILDPEVQNAFFSRLEFDLDWAGIDIIQNWESKIEVEGRPTLAPIANYNVSVLENESKWIDAFSSLYANAIVAIDTFETVNATNFIDLWNASPPEKRVFISFTKDDLIYAEQIKMILSDLGYKVFTYANSDGTRFTSPEMIVYCMKSAGEVLVLDSNNSRHKSGVIAEALAFAKYSYRPDSIIIAENKILSNQLISIIDSLKFIGINDSILIENAILAYKELEGFTYSGEEIKEKLRRNAKVNNLSTEYVLNYSKDRFKLSLTDRSNLTPYAFNKALKENLLELESLDEIDIKDRKRNVLCGMCPKYYIPVSVCPICSDY